MVRNYRSFSIVFYVAGGAGALFLWTTGHPFAALSLFSLANLSVVIPTVIPNHQWMGRTITSFETSGDEVWLTLDDGPDPEDTPVLLELLERFGAKATFFFIGERAAASPEDVRAVRDAGHSVGNHTQHHFAGMFWSLPRGLLRSEVRLGEATLDTILGERPVLFRPPVGMKNPFLQSILDRERLTHIGWSVRGFDGIASSPDKILRRLTAGLRPGAIILIHQGGRDRAEQALAPAVLEGLLRELENRKLRCVIPPPEAYRWGAGKR